ncbi:MAG TPA: carboxypeptidase-like regulatory domain-containing protein, partial [Rudaea sp.]|nr:carboxypeptidase-like regulatory domain-containing protein [Rudaea sp.]
CTFWYTNEYYPADGLNFTTRVGTFKYPSCTPVGAGGTVSGKVTATSGGAPLNGATVTLGVRSTTTDVNGNYSFASVPAGTYPTMTASFPGCTSATATVIVVADSGTTTQNFSLPNQATSACLTDTVQADFQTGAGTNVDLTTLPDSVTLLDVAAVNQQNTTLGSSGVGITTTTWGGQTFTPSATGALKRVDINLFCSGCTGTTPNLTLSIRATSGGLPTGADLAAATVAGFSSGSAVFYTADFSGSPITLTSGTQYAAVIRPTANPSPGTYALTRSGTSTAGSDVYAGGTRVSGATSGTVWSIPLTGGVSTDAGFKVYLDTGYSSSGTLISATKDANPAADYSAAWTTLSWTASTPANTSIKFQIAASNSQYGPFNFVGPDGTAATFFTTSGASLAQFNGFRYLQYEAFFATTNSAATPTLNDVTMCYANAPLPATSLVFGQQPSDVATGVAISPAVTVQLRNSLNHVVTTDSASQVSMNVASGPGTLVGGTATVTASNGVATFSNLAFTTAGTYTLSASSGSLPNTSSGSFNVLGPAQQLAFVQEPADVPRGNALGQVTVEVRDSLGHRVTSDNATVVNLSVNACGGPIALGSATAANGVATLPNSGNVRFYTIAPSLAIQAASGSLTGATSTNFQVIANSDEPFTDGFESCRL